MKLRDFTSIKSRKNFIEKYRKINLKAIDSYPADFSDAQYKNCENMIGAVQLPLGLAGPLKVNGDKARGVFYLPLATTEGALVASVSRGCKAISNSGGAITVTENIGITRGSVFKTENLKEGFALKLWLKKNYIQLEKTAAGTSKHLKLLNLDTKVVGNNVFVRFTYDTQDAMGMNMATIASEAISKIITRETGVDLISLAGNFDIDKKPAWINFILGRGRQTWAQVKLSRLTIKNVLKTTAEHIHEVCIRKCLIGSAISGSLGFNAHYANVIAALFIACGQDPAHTVEGSLGITSTELIKQDLLVSVYLPDLPVGTVGGGTNLPSQKEALAILGISGGNNGKNASKFAEIIGAAVLAGEISLLVSLAEGTLASSHQRLGR